MKQCCNVRRTHLHNFINIIIMNACVRVADVMTFTFVSLMPVHNVCRICKITKRLSPNISKELKTIKGVTSAHGIIKKSILLKRYTIA